MSNKIIIPAVIGTLLFVIIGTSIFVLSSKTDRKITLNNLISSSSSSSSSPENSSSFSVSSSNSSSSSSAKVEGSKATSSKTPMASSSKSPNSNYTKVDVLDSTNPPQYIKDYLNCNKQESGRFIDQPTLEYKCPKSLEYFGCKKTVTYGDFGNLGTKTKDGWTCDLPPIDTERECAFEIESKLLSLAEDLSNPKSSKIEQLKSKISKFGETKSTCILFTRNNKITSEEIQILESVSSNQIQIFNLN